MADEDTNPDNERKDVTLEEVLRVQQMELGDLTRRVDGLVKDVGCLFTVLYLCLMLAFAVFLLVVVPRMIWGWSWW